MNKSDWFAFAIIIAIVACVVSTAIYAVTSLEFNIDTEEVTVLDYESNYYRMHCESVAFILATEGTNKMAKRKIEKYLKVTGAKIQ